MTTWSALYGRNPSSAAPRPRSVGAALFFCALATVLPGNSPWFGPRAAHAGQVGEPKILLHVGPSRPTVIDGLCRSSSLLPPCDAIDTSGGLYPTLYPYVMLFIAEQEATAGVASVEFGIDYDSVTGSGVDIYAWDACQPAETRFDGPGGAWPTSGAGVRVEWDPDTRCQRLEPGGAGTGVLALAGHFYLSAYTPDTLSITVSPGSGQARVGDCSGAIQRVDGQTPARLGQAVFSAGGAVGGYNPCLVGTPVQPTTWSRVKRLRAESPPVLYSPPSIAGGISPAPGPARPTERGRVAPAR